MAEDKKPRRYHPDDIERSQAGLRASIEESKQMAKDSEQLVNQQRRPPRPEMPKAQ